MCQQIHSLSGQYSDMSSQLRDFERRSHTQNTNRNLEALTNVTQFLSRLQRFSVELEDELREAVHQPLVDLSNTEISAGKDWAVSFVGALRSQSDVEGRLTREIQSQSNQNKADPSRFQKLFADSERMKKVLEITRSLTREVQQDTLLECDVRLNASLQRMMRAFQTFFEDGHKFLEANKEKYEEHFEENDIETTKVNIKGMVKSGSLFRNRTKKRDWVQYHFTLKKKYLHYFESYSRNLDFKGVLVLRNCSVFAVEKEKGTEHCHQFAVNSQLGTEYFSASSAEECREWVKAIKQCIVNDEGFVKWDKPEMEEELGEIVDSFKKQKEIISNRKKNLVKLQMTQKLGEEQGIRKCF